MPHRFSLPAKPILRLAAVLFLASSGALAWAAPADEAGQILSAAGVKGGLVVHLGCGDGKLTAALRASDSYLVHGLDADAANVEKARAHIRSLGLYGPVSVQRWADVARLPYADNFVNLLVISDSGSQISQAEVIRVLAPLGVAYARYAEDTTLNLPASVVSAGTTVDFEPVVAMAAMICLVAIRLSAVTRRVAGTSRRTGSSPSGRPLGLVLEQELRVGGGEGIDAQRRIHAAQVVLVVGREERRRAGVGQPQRPDPLGDGLGRPHADAARDVRERRHVVVQGPQGDGAPCGGSERRRRPPGAAGREAPNYRRRVVPEGPAAARRSPPGAARTVSEVRGPALHGSDLLRDVRQHLLPAEEQERKGRVPLLWLRLPPRLGRGLSTFRRLTSTRMRRNVVPGPFEQ